MPINSRHTAAVKRYRGEPGKWGGKNVEDEIGISGEKRKEGKKEELKTGECGKISSMVLSTASRAAVRMLLISDWEARCRYWKTSVHHGEMVLSSVTRLKREDNEVAR